MNDDFKKLLDNISSNQLLSELIPKAIIVSKKINDPDLEKWLKLELNGYFSNNPAMTHEIKVPEYRTVGGLFYSSSNQPLIIQDPNLSFVNETRIRNGVFEIEDMKTREEKFIFFIDLKSNQLIKQNLNVEVQYFKVSKASIGSILSRIRTELLDRLISIELDLESIKEKKIR